MGYNHFGTELRLRVSFRSQNVLLKVAREKVYVQLVVRNLFGNITRGHCISTDFVKSRDGYSSLVYNTKVGAYVDSDKINRVYFVG